MSERRRETFGAVACTRYGYRHIRSPLRRHYPDNDGSGSGGSIIHHIVGSLPTEIPFVGRGAAGGDLREKNLELRLFLSIWKRYHEIGLVCVVVPRRTGSF